MCSGIYFIRHVIGRRHMGKQRSIRRSCFTEANDPNNVTEILCYYISALDRNIFDMRNNFDIQQSDL